MEMLNYMCKDVIEVLQRASLISEPYMATSFPLFNLQINILLLYYIALFICLADTLIQSDLHGL